MVLLVLNCLGGLTHCLTYWLSGLSGLEWSGWSDVLSDLLTEWSEWSEWSGWSDVLSDLLAEWSEWSGMVWVV